MRRLTNSVLIVGSIVLTAGFAGPAFAQGSGDILIRPPYDSFEVRSNGSGFVGIPATGEIRAVSAPSLLGGEADRAFFTARYELTEVARALELEARFHVDSYVSPWSVEFGFRLRADVWHDQCADCFLTGTRVVIPFTRSADLDVGIALWNRAGGPVPPGTVRLAIGLEATFGGATFVGTVTEIVGFVYPPGDLAVTKVQLEPATPQDGAVVTITATVFRQGSGYGGSSPFTVRFDLDGALLSRTRFSNSLGMGDSRTASATWTANAGSHTIRVIADEFDESMETNETNNAADHAIVVDHVRGVSLTPDTQTQRTNPKGNAVYDIAVTNTGTGPDTIELAKTSDADGWSATLSQTSVILEAGQSATVQLTVTAAAKPGAFSVTITGKSAAQPTVQDTAEATTASKK